MWCGESNKLFTTGFSKMSERQYAVWEPTDLSSALKVEMIDTGSGVLFPVYDNDTQIIYVGGKGDGNIRYFELDSVAPYCHFINDFKSSTPQRGLGWLPKRGVNVGDCEVARCYKLTPKGSVEIVSFIVPRKVCMMMMMMVVVCVCSFLFQCHSVCLNQLILLLLVLLQSTLFQEDIFPPTKVDAANVTVDRWLAGENAVPTKFSLKVRHCFFSCRLVAWVVCS